MIRKIMSKTRGCSSSSARSSCSEDISAKISKKAYELYEKRGRVSGHELEDWLKAEKLVKSGKC